MKLLLPALAFLAISGATPSSAASLCNCCASGTAEICSGSCGTVKPPEGACLPAVDFAGQPVISPGINPLYDVPLKTLKFGEIKRSELEDFRRLLEASRRAAEKDRKAALRSLASGKIDREAADSAARRYDDAIVNYYLGLRAYRNATRK